MDSRPGPVRHCRSCRSCVSHVYAFSKKKNNMEGCSVLYRKADIPEGSEKGIVL